MAKALKAIPSFQSETQERRFWETHDSTEYVDWSQAKVVAFPSLKPSTKSISLRLPVDLLERIKVEANRRDVPYQSLIQGLAEGKDWLDDTRHPNKRTSGLRSGGEVLFISDCSKVTSP